MSCCCGSAAENVVNLTNINTQISTIIEGWNVIWIAAAFDITAVFPDTPDDYDADPGDAGDEIAQRNRALCLAVDSWITELMNRGIDYIEKSILIVTPIGVAGLANPIVPTWLIGGAFAAAALALAELHSQMSDDEYRDYLKCAMYDALLGESTTGTAAFAESWDNLPARPPPPESGPENLARDAIEAWGRSQLNNVDNYLGFIKTLNSAMSIASALTDDDCGCIASWEFEFDFTVSDGGWVTDPQDGSGWGATYSAGNGWVNSGSGGEKSLAIKLTTMTKNANFDQTKWEYILGTALTRRARVQTVLVIDTDSDDVTPEDTFVTFNGDLDIATQTLHCLILSAGGGSSHTLEKVTFKGTGINPFT